MLREIPLKKFPPFPGTVNEVTSLGIITQVLVSARPGASVDLATNRQIFKVMDAVESAEKSLVDKLFLDNASWEFLKTRYATMPFAFPDRIFNEIEDDIQGAQLVDPNKAPVATAEEAPPKTVVQDGGKGPQPIVRPATAPPTPNPATKVPAKKKGA